MQNVYKKSILAVFILKMFMIIDKGLILNKIKEHYSFKSDAAFARFLEIKPQTLATWYSRNTFDIDLLYSKCELIDGNFLLSGTGNLLRSNTDYDNKTNENYQVSEEIVRLNDKIKDLQTINELLTRTVADLDKRNSSELYLERKDDLFDNVAEQQPELIKVKKQKKDDAKK